MTNNILQKKMQHTARAHCVRDSIPQSTVHSSFTSVLNEIEATSMIFFEIFTI